MGIFNQHTAYDKVQDTVFNICKEAMVEGNKAFMLRDLPIISIAEDEEKSFTNVTLDDTDENDFQPRVVEINKALVEALNNESLDTLVKTALRFEDDYITEKTVSEKEDLYLIDKDNEALTHKVEINYTTKPLPITDVTYDEIKTISFEDLSDKLKKLVEEVEEDTSKKTISTYKIEVKEKEATIVTKDNERYVDVPLTDKKYEDLIPKVEEIEEILDSAIDSSGMSKTASESAGKRLHIRNIIAEKPKEFYNNKMMYGKTLDIVVVLDRSGSMRGIPAINSAILITALNNLCLKYKELTSTVIFSDNYEYSKMDLPVGNRNSKQLLEFTETYDAEGLAENMDKEIDRIEEADVVFVYTDGNIVSGPVDKPRYTAKGIELTGLYTTGRDLTNEDYEKHYNKNKSWFHNVIVSKTATDLSEHMCDYMKK